MSRGTHVKFAVDTNMETGHIHLQCKGDITEAHIGMLKNHHTYTADVPIPHSLGSNVTAEHPQHNIYIRVAEISETKPQPKSDQFSTVVTLQVKTLREGNIAENIEIISEDDPTQRMCVLITAKVLLGNQGNPMLKDGVHVVSHEHRDESDFTEWPGHGNEDPED